MSLALDAQTDIVSTQRVISDIELKKQQERFGIAVSTDSNNLLNISVSNLGQNPVGISSFWIINKTLTDAPATRYEISYEDSFVTGSSSTQILLSQPLYMTPDTYDVKVVSSLGTIEIAELDVSAGGSSSNALRSVLVTDPPDVILGQNVTIGMVVTNIGQLSITGVTPSTPSVNPPGAEVASSNPNLSSVDLIPGESFLFLWDYTIDGTADTDVDFSSFATGLDVNNNLVQSNVVSDTSTLREDSESEGGEGEVVIKDELFGKPQLFMMMPNAVGQNSGDNNDRAIWGVNVANPTDQPMFVSKVVIIAISPRATSSDKIFIEQCEKSSYTLKPEGVETISPTSDKWSCPESNQLMWKDIVTPQRIEPRSVFPFLAKITGANMGGTLADAQNILIQPIVFTSLGQFASSGYGSTMHSKDVALPNVFLARNPQSVSSLDILGNMTGIVEGTTVTFNATLADMSSDDTYGINSGTDLIINIPKEWTFGSVVSYAGFNTPTVVTYPDDSTQIVGDLINSIDNHSEAKTITFTATAPSVTSAKMYVMHILANGIATGDVSGGASVFTVGPIAETVLQVCPTSGCP